MAAFQDSLFVEPALLQQAEQQLRKRFETAPDNPGVVRSLAEVVRKLGNLAEASMLYDQLARLTPHDPEAAYLSAVFGGRLCSAPPAGMRAAPFVLLKNFLPPDVHEALLPFVSASREKFREIAPKPDEYANPASRQALQYEGIDWKGRREVVRCLKAALAEVIPRMYVPEFQPGPFEIVLRAYQEGHFFRIHQDATPDSRYLNRMLNYVYYFHKQPRPYKGGELLLFDTDVPADTFTMSRFTRVIPEDNSVIFFPPNYYHCVIPVRCSSQDFMDSRFVINGHLLDPTAKGAPETGSNEPVVSESPAPSLKEQG